MLEVVKDSNNKADKMVVDLSKSKSWKTQS